MESEPLPPDSSDGTAPFDGDSQESWPPSETEDTVDDSLPPKNNTEESQNVTDSSEDAVSDQNSQSESAKQTGLVETENGTVYINPDGSYFTGEKYIDGKGWAYFDPANGGLMVKGWFNLDWRTVYYLSLIHICIFWIRKRRICCSRLTAADSWNQCFTIAKKGIS